MLQCFVSILLPARATHTCFAKDYRVVRYTIIHILICTPIKNTSRMKAYKQAYISKLRYIYLKLLNMLLVILNSSVLSDATAYVGNYLIVFHAAHHLLQY